MVEGPPSPALPCATLYHPRRRPAPSSNNPLQNLTSLASFSVLTIAVPLSLVADQHKRMGVFSSLLFSLAKPIRGLRIKQKSPFSCQRTKMSQNTWTSLQLIRVKKVFQYQTSCALALFIYKDKDIWINSLLICRYQVISRALSLKSFRVKRMLPHSIGSRLSHNFLWNWVENYYFLI